MFEERRTTFVFIITAVDGLASIDDRIYHMWYMYGLCSVVFWVLVGFPHGQQDYFTATGVIIQLPQ